MFAGKNQGATGSEARLLFPPRRAQCHDRLTDEGFSCWCDGSDERRGAWSGGTVRTTRRNERSLAGRLHPHPVGEDGRNRLRRELALGEEVADGAVVVW